MRPITFRQVALRSGKFLFEPVNEEARDTMDFLNEDPSGVPEGRFDRIYDWLTRLGHEVIVYEKTEFRHPLY